MYEKYLLENQDRYENIQEMGVIATLTAAAVVAGIAKVAHFIFTMAERRAQKACRNYRGNERVSCVTRYKVNAMKLEKSKLQSGMGRCAQTNDPNGCKQKLQDKVEKLDRKIEKESLTLQSV